MNARKLHDFFELRPVYVDFGGIEHRTILRALDLLARTEESTDELVRELCEIAKGHDYQCAFDKALILSQAAATIVALKAELAEWKASGEKMAQRFNEVVAELTKLAEAFRKGE